MVGLGVGPPCLRVVLEETLLTWTDERAPLARTAPCITPVDKSETRTPVRELMWFSVLGESSVGCLQEPIYGVESLEYAIQTTASVWMPFKQTYNGVSGNTDFDSFEMAPWDAGGIHGDGSQSRDVMCRPTIVHELDRKTTMNMENELDMIILIDTESPRLTVTPGECYASYGSTQIRCDLRHTHDTSAMTDSYTMKPNDMIVRRPAECDENYSSPKMDSTAVELNVLALQRLRLPQRNISAERDKNYVNVPA